MVLVLLEDYVANHIEFFSPNPSVRPSSQRWFGLIFNLTGGNQGSCNPLFFGAVLKVLTKEFIFNNLGDFVEPLDPSPSRSFGWGCPPNPFFASGGMKDKETGCFLWVFLLELSKQLSRERFPHLHAKVHVFPP